MIYLLNLLLPARYAGSRSIVLEFRTRAFERERQELLNPPLERLVAALERRPFLALRALVDLGILEHPLGVVGVSKGRGIARRAIEAYICGDVIVEDAS